jgi:hypothetical protein
MAASTVVAVEFENTKKAEEIINKAKKTVDTVVTIRFLLVIVLFFALFIFFLSFTYMTHLLCVNLPFWGGGECI